MSAVITICIGACISALPRWGVGALGRWGVGAMARWRDGSLANGYLAQYTRGFFTPARLLKTYGLRGATFLVVD